MRIKRGKIAIVMFLVIFCSLANCTVALGYSLPERWPDKWKVRFDHYYTHKEMLHLIKQMACLYPWLVKVNRIGESFLGKDLWVLEITNRRCGEALKKPAFVVIGPHHGDEVIGANVVLYFTWYLLTNYGKDATVTHILDTKTVYVIPLVNPDGNDITLQKDIYGRFNARPMDEDFDGLLDEDDPEDINGDGKITEMRQWDPTINDYNWYWEGIDNDGDGLINEDWYGGVDLNRNYEVGWTPLPPEWPPYYGESPFSEPETQAIRDFVLAHPNIAIGFDTHSGAQVILYSWAFKFDPTPDNMIFKALGERYSGIIGYAYGQTPYMLYPCPGTTMDWMYSAHGVIHLTSEVFGSFYFDPEDPWNETKFFQTYPEALLDWQEFNHPQLGTVEIGGIWAFRYHNPPETEIISVCEKYLPMLLDMVKGTPDLEFTRTEFHVSRGHSYCDVSLYIDLSNVGFLATATQLALESGTACPVTVSVKFSPKVMLIEGKPTIELDVLHGGQTVGLKWKVRVKVPSMNWFIITAETPKGGIEKLLVIIFVSPYKTKVLFHLLST